MNKVANDYVATKAGWYYVGVEPGSGPYQITFEGYRPVLADSNPKSGRQLAAIMGTITVFLIVLVIVSMWAASKG